MSKAYVLARVDLRWALTRLVVLGALMAAAWFGGYYFSMFWGHHDVHISQFAQETLNQVQPTPAQSF